MVKKAVDYIRVPKKFFYVVLGIVVLIALATSLKPTVVEVDVDRVTKGVFKDVIIDEGITSFRKKNVISASGDGIVPKIILKEGDKVKKGQLLYTFIWDVNRPVRSPIDGFVINVFEKDKRHVMKGTPIIEIGDPRSLEVVAKLLTEDAVHIKPGQNVKINKWGGEKPLLGIVRKVVPTAFEEVSALGVKEQRVNVLIDMVSERELWQTLGDGYKLEVEVIKMQHENATLLPVGALFENQHGFATYVYKDKVAHLKQIQIESKNNDFAMVKSGVSESDIVLVYPGKEIKDGVKVKAKAQ